MPWASCRRWARALCWQCSVALYIFLPSAAEPPPGRHEGCQDVWQDPGAHRGLGKRGAGGRDGAVVAADRGDVVWAWEWAALIAVMVGRNRARGRESSRQIVNAGLNSGLELLCRGSGQGRAARQAAPMCEQPFLIGGTTLLTVNWSIRTRVHQRGVAEVVCAVQAGVQAAEQRRGQAARQGASVGLSKQTRQHPQQACWTFMSKASLKHSKRVRQATSQVRRGARLAKSRMATGCL